MGGVFSTQSRSESGINQEFVAGGAAGGCALGGKGGKAASSRLGRGTRWPVSRSRTSSCSSNCVEGARCVGGRAHCIISGGWGQRFECGGGAHHELVVGDGRVEEGQQRRAPHGLAAARAAQAAGAQRLRVDGEV